MPLNNLFLAFNRPLDGYLFGALRAPGGATPITIPQAVGPLAPQQIFLPLLEV